MKVAWGPLSMPVDAGLCIWLLFIFILNLHFADVIIEWLKLNELCRGLTGLPAIPQRSAQKRPEAPIYILLHISYKCAIENKRTIWNNRSLFFLSLQWLFALALKMAWAQQETQRTITNWWRSDTPAATSWWETLKSSWCSTPGTSASCRWAWEHRPLRRADYQ